MSFGGMDWVLAVSVAALGVSAGILLASIHFHKKAITNSTKILDMAKHHSHITAYLKMEDIVEKSKKGYDVFLNLHTFFNTYEGVWIDDKIKQFVDDKSREIKEFEKTSPYYTEEPEQKASEEEIEKFLREEQEDYENLSLIDRYNRDFEQKFRDTKKKLLDLIETERKNLTKKINEK